MARKITTGRVGRAVLGSLTTVSNGLQTVVTNANLLLEPNGTGITVSTKDLQVNAQGNLRLADADSSNYIALRAPTTVASNVTLTFPTTAGTNTQMLQTDGSGNLSWAAPFVAVANQTTDSATYYPTLTTATSGTVSTINTSSTKLTYQPSSGTLTTTALVESSSLRLKENILPIENALNAILLLTGVTYDRKDGSTKNEAGLIAEDVYKVLPNLVTRDEDGNPYGINYTKFSAYLIEAIKSLKQEINSLK
jgi:hypothetical protein